MPESTAPAPDVMPESAVPDPEVVPAVDPSFIVELRGVVVLWFMEPALVVLAPLPGLVASVFAPVVVLPVVVFWATAIVALNAAAAALIAISFLFIEFVLRHVG